MLYDRWLEIVRQHRREPALWDPGEARWWTFDQLAQEAKSSDPGPSSPAYPQGLGAAFVRTTLRAWRAGRVVCPLEVGLGAPAVPPPPPGIIHLKTTSATTGVPRLVAFTASQLAADVDHIVETMGLRPAWPNLGVISLAHSYGFSSLVLPLCLHGIPLVLAASSLPESVRRAAAQVDALTLPAVPALWRAWQDAAAIPRNIRLAISAGAPLPLSLERAVFGSCGLKIHNFYGSSECGGIAYDATFEPRPEGDCAGQPMRNVQLSLHQEGCLEVRGLNVGETYWPEPQPTLAGGCFRTSDLAEFRSGWVCLRGRASDVINVAGRKVSPETIEQVLSQHPAVGECLVLGIPSPEGVRSEVIGAVVVLREAASIGMLRDFVAARLPSWQLPREWRLVETLAVNERGKASRAEWRARF